jgi:LysM repeat protein
VRGGTIRCAMDDRARSPLRLLAPLALALATLVFLVVIASGVVGGDEESASTGTAERTPSGKAEQQSDRSGDDSYEVQEGDTLDGIAAETGVSVEELQELNPDLDPQSLVTGQELQLTE